MVDNRVTRTTRSPYGTRSNLLKKVLTPGGRTTVTRIAKKSRGAICGDCKVSLPGIKHHKSSDIKNLKKRERKVCRPYGGSRCGNCVKSRIVRAFLIEEQKIVKKMMAEKKK
jgi:large subunit ribosomal protein L34e